MGFVLFIYQRTWRGIGRGVVVTGLEYFLGDVGSTTKLGVLLILRPPPSRKAVANQRAVVLAIQSSLISRSELASYCIREYFHVCLGLPTLSIEYDIL